MNKPDGNITDMKYVQTLAAMPVNIHDLADICDVEIDLSLSVSEKQLSYLKQIKNPALYRCGDMIVRISYVSTGVRLADRLKQYLLSKQGITLN